MTEFGPRSLVGDCREILPTLPSESVHCCITSPPYWSLRDYGVEGQIGLEPTPEEHIAVLLEVFREVRRVLRKDGLLWLNYGDCYASAWPCQRRNVVGTGSLENGKREARPPRLPSGLKEKDLVGMPWRVAFALQADGWYLRSDIIWHKPNPMPESVTDRPTRAHEYLFLLAKSERYYYDADAIREKHQPGSVERTQHSWNGERQRGYTGNAQTLDFSKMCHPAGRNKRTVWEIATQPTPEAHFATFPEALVEPCLLAGTSEWGCCPECAAPWERVVEKESRPNWQGEGSQKHDGTYYRENPGGGVANDRRARRETGWRPTCTHGRESVPCTVLDPFGGSGTVGKVATRLGRRSILIELNPDYTTIAARRNAQLGMLI